MATRRVRRRAQSSRDRSHFQQALRDRLGVRAQPGVVAHGAIPITARRDPDRRAGKGRGQPGHVLAVPAHGADDGGLVSRRWLSDVLQGEVARRDVALPDPSGEGYLLSIDDDGNRNEENIAAYLKADLLDEFGFSEWVGPEPHGLGKHNTGTVKDVFTADETIELVPAVRHRGQPAAVADGVLVS